MTAGVPAPFTSALGQQVCDGLLEGKSLKDIAESIGLHYVTIQKWAVNNPLFADAMRLARAESAHVLLDQARAAAVDPEMDHRRAKNLIHVLLFAAERRNRKDYGPTMDMTVTDRVQLGDTIIEARKRQSLPICNPGDSALPQPAEYVLIPSPKATDTQSDAPPKAPYNPFD